MIQIIYASSANPRATIDVDALLDQAQRNNRLRSVTGLLYFDGARFLQVLEGDEASVGTTFARIEADPRHRALVTLSRRDIGAREFGDWAMAYRSPADDADDFIDRIRALVRPASPEVRGIFEGLAEARRAA